MIEKHNHADLMLVASHWLYLWADCLRLREENEPVGLEAVCESGSRSMYAKGAAGVGEYRPADDPDPMCFVFLQVEHCLGSHDGPIWKFARHVWFERKPAEEYAHEALGTPSRTTLYRLRQRILKRLVSHIEYFSPENLASQSVRQAQQRLFQERKRRLPV